MTIRQDAKVNIRAQNTGNAIVCSTSLTLEEKHWAEAEAAVGGDRGKQKDYIAVQTAKGCDDRCGCDGLGAKASFLDEDSTVTAHCNLNPNETGALTEKNIDIL